MEWREPVGYGHPWIQTLQEGQGSLYVKEGIVSSRLEPLQWEDSSTEVLQGPKTNVVLGTCYHPPDQNAQSDLEMEIGEASK